MTHRLMSFRLTRPALFLVILAVLALLTRFVRAEGVLVTLKIGSPAPAFTLTNANPANAAKDISLSDLKGSIVVIVFDSTRCPVAAAYHERMQDFFQGYTVADRAKAKPVVFLAINSNSNPDETADEIAQHSRKHHLTYPVLKDADSKVADLYGAACTPHVFVIDIAGNVRYVGAFDDSQKPAEVTHHYLTDAVDALIAAKPVTTPQTDAFGCSIKRP